MKHDREARYNHNYKSEMLRNHCISFYFFFNLLLFYNLLLMSKMRAKKDKNNYKS